jgi:hypothetical protein
VGTVEATCPICGTSFEARVDLSGTQFGMRLDTKPLGPIAAPWRLKVCPKDHFVVLDEELSENEVKDLRAFVGSQEYQSQVEGNSSYYLLALLLERRGASASTLAYTYLQASWQVESDPALCHTYLRHALHQYGVHLAASKGANDRATEDDTMAELLSLEIERRLGKFEAAGERLERLRANPKLTEELGWILVYQDELIEAGDRVPHQLPAQRPVSDDQGEPLDLDRDNDEIEAEIEAEIADTIERIAETEAQETEAAQPASPIESSPEPSTSPPPGQPEWE